MGGFKQNLKRNKDRRRLLALKKEEKLYMKNPIADKIWIVVNKLFENLISLNIYTNRHDSSWQC